MIFFRYVRFCHFAPIYDDISRYFVLFMGKPDMSVMSVLGGRAAGEPGTAMIIWEVLDMIFMSGLPRFVHGL